MLGKLGPPQNKAIHSTNPAFNCCIPRRDEYGLFRGGEAITDVTFAKSVGFRSFYSGGL